MPLFSVMSRGTAEPAAAEAALEKPGLFHSRREPSPARTTSTTTSSSGDVRSLSFLHKGFHKMGIDNNDRDLNPSILRAREHVMSAQAAEEEADRALNAAKRRAREAREHIRRLEEEAEADAPRTRIKEDHAAEVSKRGKVLGRRGL